MPRELKEFLADILEHIGNIEEFIQGMTLADFEHDRLCRQSVYWSLFTVAEAITEVPRQDPPLVGHISEYRDIHSARNLLAHSYFAINPVRIWDTCPNSLPVLRAEVMQIAARY